MFVSCPGVRALDEPRRRLERRERRAEARRRAAVGDDADVEVRAVAGRARDAVAQEEAHVRVDDGRASFADREEHEDRRRRPRGGDDVEDRAGPEAQGADGATIRLDALRV